MSDFLKIKQIDGLSAQLAAKALDSEVVKKANNLSDVTATTARTNLSVYSKAEVDSLIVGAQNAYSVASITERNALTGLKISDRVFVSNDGDSKWALYIVTAVTTGTGSTSTFEKIADEDLFSNALTAQAIKAAYESNEDTFAFNGVRKTKVDYITITKAINLDEVSGVADLALGNAAIAQTTANNAASAASTAQSTANTALTNAATAQSTATAAATAAATAQNTANGKEDAFNVTTQLFTNLTGAASSNMSLTLSNAPKAGFTVNVFFNGIRVRQIIWSAGNPVITYIVPYSTESTDYITVEYTY